MEGSYLPTQFYTPHAFCAFCSSNTHHTRDCFPTRQFSDFYLEQPNANFSESGSDPYFNGYDSGRGDHQNFLWHDMENSAPQSHGQHFQANFQPNDHYFQPSFPFPPSPLDELIVANKQMMESMHTQMMDSNNQLLASLASMQSTVESINQVVPYHQSQVSAMIDDQISQIQQRINAKNHEEEETFSFEFMANPKENSMNDEITPSNFHHENDQVVITCENDEMVVEDQIVATHKMEEFVVKNEEKDDEIASFKTPEQPLNNPLLDAPPSMEDPLKACLAHFNCEDFNVDNSISEVNSLLNIHPPIHSLPWSTSNVSLSWELASHPIPSFELSQVVEPKPPDKCEEDVEILKDKLSSIPVLNMTLQKPLLGALSPTPSSYNSNKPYNPKFFIEDEEWVEVFPLPLFHFCLQALPPSLLKELSYLGKLESLERHGIG
ncbi:uncharacterized protein LOC132283560 [Cornus florida]|uniref:uncharacterized protein LOC132283560 n=1 Tax=Cornus florida TaxID=4283 RepID=UPI0028A0A048|nr:uncharacterized protein LOC132283560 [Cornus florida]XP_059641510.1 uncharacterized protein LOC132283560 [Cornus florida]XP_059641511.1 uncharacterized protein LOC132283560 [Cornus florida]XP_059641512.1 uncharacterized protein LOC132283560 [Cornus florida]XP_059641513.1 uncharacterized protein LOC132283560 [Cornus florida]XP_059641514.1 uncharacterized protein LOC132283560 [Cornus florida]